MTHSSSIARKSPLQIFQSLEAFAGAFSSRWKIAVVFFLLLGGVGSERVQANDLQARFFSAWWGAAGDFWTPEVLSPDLWLDAASSEYITEIDGRVDVWQARFGTNDATATAADRRPLYDSNALNGLGAVRFQGSTNLMEIVGLDSNSSNMTSMAVFQRNSGQYVFAARRPGTATRWWVPYFVSSEWRWLVGATAVRASTAARSTDWNFAGARLSVPDFSAHFNGTVIATQTNVTLSVVGEALPHYLGGNEGTANYDGYIAEVLHFLRTLSDEDMKRIEGYLAHKWGLTAELPIGHPYKDSPP
jgi:hypothetical protein